MNAWRIFTATLPFVWLKLLLSMIHVIILSIAVAIIVYNVATQGRYIINIDAETIHAFNSLRFFALPLTLIFIIAPLTSLLLRVVGRYLIRVGHIAVLVRIATTGKAPKRQISWGLSEVKKTFGKATVFFFLNRMVHNSVVELQHITRNMLAGIGFLAFFVNAFKQRFIKHIDECCLAYTYMCKDTGAFFGAIKGIVVYVNGWKSMATASVRVMIEVTILSTIFYLLSIFIIINGIMQQNVPIIVIGIFIFFFVGAAKKCILDSYTMVTMLVAFLNEAKRQGDVTIPKIAQIAALSGIFSSLIFQANKEEQFMSEEDETLIHQSQAKVSGNNNQNNTGGYK